MTCSSDARIPEKILRLMQPRAVWRNTAIQNEYFNQTGKWLSSGALRVHLHRLVAEGRLQRFSVGSYSLPGRKPDPTTLKAWLSRALVLASPNAPSLTALRNGYMAAFGYAPAKETFVQTLDEMKAEGLAERAGPDAYKAPLSQTQQADTIFD